MDKFVSDLFSRPLPISNDALVVYFIMRSDIARNESVTSRILKEDGKLVCGLDVHTIAQRSGLSELKVITMFDLLSNVGWLKSFSKNTYQLGEVNNLVVYWYVEELPEEIQPKEDEVVDEIVRLANEQNKRSESKRPKQLSQKVQQKIAAESLGGLVRKEKASTQVLTHFCTKVEKLSGQKPDLNYQTKYVYAGRLLRWCNEDINTTKEFIDWTLKNWKLLKDIFSAGDFPTWNLLCTKAVFDSVSRFRLKGIPTPEQRAKKDTTGLATRADTKEIEGAKDAGW